MDELKTFSLVFNWQDNDHEQGTWGTTVRAADHAEAETKARAEMREAHIANHCDADADADEIAESCAEYEDDGKFGGSLVECSEGAIWKAADLEKALRHMRAAYTKLHDFLSDAIEGGRLTEAHIPDDYKAIRDQLEECASADAGAETVLNEIDKIA